MQSVCTNASAHARIDGMFKNEIQYETNYKMNKKLECMSRRSKTLYGYEYTTKSWYFWSRVSFLENPKQKIPLLKSEIVTLTQKDYFFHFRRQKFLLAHKKLGFGKKSGLKGYRRQHLIKITSQNYYQNLQVILFVDVHLCKYLFYNLI